MERSWREAGERDSILETIDDMPTAYMPNFQFPCDSGRSVTVYNQSRWMRTVRCDNTNSRTFIQPPARDDTLFQRKSIVFTIELLGQLINTDA